MRPVLVLPGWTNSGPEHWQTLWERAHPAYRRVEQRDWDVPDRASWVAALDTAVRAAARPPVVVAHSLGCVTVARWAAEHSCGNGARLGAALLVAPADVERDDLPEPVRGFGPIPRLALGFPCTLVASRDDPYLDFDRAEELARAWGAELVDAGYAGHLNAAAGYGPWPEGEEILARLMARVA